MRRTAAARARLRRAAARCAGARSARRHGGERRRSKPVRAPTCPWHPRHARRGARNDHGAPHPRPHFSRAGAHHPSPEICVGPAAPGMTRLTRCTAAGADRSGRAAPMGATSPAPRPAPPEEEPRFAWSGALCGYLGVGRQPAGRPPASARTPDPNWRAMLFAAAAAVLCCCTSPWNCGLGLSNYASDLGWSYGDSNPRPLACHESLTHPPTRPNTV